MEKSNFVHAGNLSDLESAGCMAVQAGGHLLALFSEGGLVYAVDNRCPHMGFPLDRGSVNGGILTCHWHHARFDLESGGTFDQFADDVRTFPVELRGNEIWVDLAARGDPRAHQRERLLVGLERDIPLVMGKAVQVLMEGDGDPRDPFRIGLDFGARYRRGGWGQGLTMHACFMNLMPALRVDDRPRAMYHGLAAVARDSFGHAPRFPVRPLPDSSADFRALKAWFRRFIAVRDDEGAERCVVSAIRAGATGAQMADMLFSAVTDYRMIDAGHPADFTNKAFEALDLAGWEYAETVLTSLTSGYAGARRMEESNAWRNPIDLVLILEDAFEKLPAALQAGEAARADRAWEGFKALVEILLEDDPGAIGESLLEALREGSRPEELASAVSYAAALRIARFHTSNEFTDWDSSLHTFTFANAIEQGLRRSPSVETLRGVFDAAMSVYLDRFLNIPPARIPDVSGDPGHTKQELARLPDLLDQQQQVNQAAASLARYLSAEGDDRELLAMIGRLLLREDRDFHTIQTIEAAFRQYAKFRGKPEGVHVLVAAIRYLAAHAPTVRAQGQTYEIAYRLHRGDRLYEG
ncbi:MAG: Rieske (2Fe-2S) protein [Anaerolineales bacterium]|nr:Rieske (2Fe-2S) protein [Anaerolineales bacterium]